MLTQAPARSGQLEFVLFSNGSAFPIELAASKPLTFTDADAPRHLHLAHAAATAAGDAQMRVMWASSTLQDDAVVQWGLAPGQLSSNASATPATYTRAKLCGPPANAHGFWQPPWFYSATVPVGASDSLPPLSRVYYRCGSNRTGWTAERSFRTPQPPSAISTLHITTIADVGESYIDGSQYHW